MRESDGKRTLGLRGSRTGQVKQSFSHGRTKNVVVETKRKRVVKPGAATVKHKSAVPTAAPEEEPSGKPAGISEEEFDRRMKAVCAGQEKRSHGSQASCGR